MPTPRQVRINTIFEKLALGAAAEATLNSTGSIEGTCPWGKDYNWPIYYYYHFSIELINEIGISNFLSLFGIYNRTRVQYKTHFLPITLIPKVQCPTFETYFEIRKQTYGQLNDGKWDLNSICPIDSRMILGLNHQWVYQDYPDVTTIEVSGIEYTIPINEWDVTMDFETGLTLAFMTYFYNIDESNYSLTKLG